MAGARVVARRAKQLAPVSATGDLKQSIKAMRDPDWRTQSGRKVALAGSKLFYSSLVEFGTAHTAARPFLRPAADSSAVEIRAKIEANLSAGIDREIAKQAYAARPGDDPTVT